MTTRIMTTDAITTALWGAPASHCPPDGAVLAYPGTDRKAWPGETDESVAWCHDCRADGLGFVRARMLDGSERVSVTFDTHRAALGEQGPLVGPTDDLIHRVIGRVITGREFRALVGAAR